VSHPASSPLHDGAGYLTANGIRHWYRIAGSANGGPPVVILHGEPGGNLYVFEHTIGARLEGFATLVYYEQRGCGRSGLPSGPNDYTIPTLAADLEGLCAGLGLEQMVLLGFSFGARLALEFALARPERVAGLILSGPVAVELERIVRVQMDGLLFTAQGEVKDALAAINARPGDPVERLTRALQVVDATTLDRLQFLDPGIAQRVHQLEEESGLPLNTAFQRTLLAAPPRCPPLLDELPKITAPALVLCGLHDRNAGLEASRDLVARLPSGELGVFQSSAHYPYLEEPYRYTVTLRDWLQRTVLAAEGRPFYQLQMVWPYARLVDLPQPRLPPGYSLRMYQPGDEPAFYRIMAASGWPGWDDQQLEPWLWRILPDSWYMVIHTASGQIIASAMALHSAEPRHPFGAELAWVCSDPAHRGRGLGLAVVAASTRRMIAAGYRNIHLYSEDFRLPALKTYLKLGYMPLLYSPDMPARWQAICDQLTWPYQPEQWETARS